MPDDYEMKVHRFLSQYNDFFINLLEKLYRDMLVEIKQRMSNAGYHDKLIENVRLSEIHFDEESGKVDLKIISDYVSSRVQPDGQSHEFNVSDGMAEGTQPHEIKQRWAPLLRWVDKMTGQRRSAIQVYNPGMGKGQNTNIKELGVVKKTFDELMPKIQVISDRASIQFLVSTLGGGQMPQALYERGELV